METTNPSITKKSFDKLEDHKTVEQIALQFNIVSTFETLEGADSLSPESTT
jgi:hypothetical protein